jgi:hypothetical protein
MYLKLQNKRTYSGIIHKRGNTRQLKSVIRAKHIVLILPAVKILNTQHYYNHVEKLLNLNNNYA